mgnify:CR=1 FL=1
MGIAHIESVPVLHCQVPLPLPLIVTGMSCTPKIYDSVMIGEDEYIAQLLSASHAHSWRWNCP